jgi:hypothetical protein
MNIKKLTIKNPFEMHYDPVSRELTLIHDEILVDHCRFELAFDAAATGVLWDLLVTIAMRCGGKIGAPHNTEPTKQ